MNGKREHAGATKVIELPIRVSEGEAHRLVDMLGAQMVSQINNQMSCSPVVIARRLLAVYQLKHQILSDVSSDTSWIMLLDLYVARFPKRDISVSSVCVASLSPPSTALRHLRILVDQGFVDRVHPVHDARLVYVTLSAHGVTTVERLLQPLC